MRTRWLIGPRIERVISGIPILLFLLFFSVIPLFYLGQMAWVRLGGLRGIWSTLWGPGLAPQLARTALANSLEQGLLSAGIALGVGLVIGVHLSRSGSAFWDRMRGLMLLPFLLPSLVMVFGTVGLFGTHGILGGPFPATQIFSHGLAGIIFVNVMFNAPAVALFTAASLDGVPRHLEEAARVQGATAARAFTTVALRPALTGAGLGGVLTFLLSFLSFAPPLLLGGPAFFTMEDWIYASDKLIGFEGTPTAAALALWSVVLLAAPILVYLTFLRGTRLVGRGPGSGNSRPNPVLRSRWTSYLLGILTAGFAALEVLLLFSVVEQSLTDALGRWTTSSWEILASSRVTSFLQVSLGTTLFNTVFFAILAGGIVFALALPLQFVEGKSFWGWEALGFFPLLISPVILALGLEVAWGGSLGSTSLVWVLIVISQASIALPFGLQAIGVSFHSQPPSLVEAARTLGSTRFQAFSDIRYPLARPGIQAALLLTLAVGLGEFTATNFLYIPQFATLSVEIYELQVIRLNGPAFAVAALLVFLSLGVFVILSVIQPSRRDLE